MCSAAPLRCLTTPLAGPHLRVHRRCRNTLIGGLSHGWLIFCQTAVKVSESEWTQSDSEQGIKRALAMDPEPNISF